MSGIKVWRIGLALLLAVTVIGTGCSTNWSVQAREIVAVLIPAATNLVKLVAALQGNTVSAEDLAAVQHAGTEVRGDLLLIQELIAGYESADQAAKPGILNQIQSAMGVTRANLQELLSGLHIKDAATQEKITAIVGILSSEVEALAAIVPIVQGQGSGARAQRPAVARVAGRVKSPLSAGEFVKSYNSILTAGSGNVELDGLTAGLRIRVHSDRDARAE